MALLRNRNYAARPHVGSFSISDFAPGCKGSFEQKRRIFQPFFCASSAEWTACSAHTLDPIAVGHTPGTRSPRLGRPDGCAPSGVSGCTPSWCWRHPLRRPFARGHPPGVSGQQPPVAGGSGTTGGNVLIFSNTSHPRLSRGLCKP